ncbi:MAG TPA: DUF6064 family protein [Gemmatimonadaceae bacterium]
MRLPFTIDEFFEVFRRYNEAVWPAQWVLIAIALVAIVAATGRHPRLRAVPMMALALLWLWMGIVYHGLFFRAINPAAAIFMILFVAQGAAFLWVTRRPVTDAHAVSAGAGAILMTYALLVYPALGLLMGHRYPESPTFGLPCPTTIFTLGLLLWVRQAFPRPLLIVPVLWAIVGTSAALQLGMLEDLGLPVAALVAIVLTVRRRPRPVLRTISPHRAT